MCDSNEWVDLSETSDDESSDEEKYVFLLSTAVIAGYVLNHPKVADVPQAPLMKIEDVPMAPALGSDPIVPRYKPIASEQPKVSRIKSEQPGFVANLGQITSAKSGLRSVPKAEPKVQAEKEFVFKLRPPKKHNFT